MKVLFLIDDLRLNGGTGVVLEHAHQLRERHGFDARVATLRPEEAGWEHRRLVGVPVSAIGDVGDEPFDLAVATWWRSAHWVLRVNARRHVSFVQSFEDRFYEPPNTGRMLAALTHALPVAFLTEASWIAEQLRALRPDATVELVPNGIAKDLFGPVDAPPDLGDGALQVLIEGHPEVWFKGIGDALAALERVREPVEATLVSPTAVEHPTVGRTVGPLDQAALVAEYDRSHVVLKTSRVEGMYGPPLEAFHRGATVVTTPVTGHDMFVVHGRNGLVVDFDDLRGTARALDLLARDRELLARLRAQALDTARAWPSWEESADQMAAALSRLLEGPAPDPLVAAARAQDDAALFASEQRRAYETTSYALSYAIAERDHARNDVSNVLAEVDAARGQVAIATAEIQRLRAHPWHRLGQHLQRALDTPTGRRALPLLRRLRRRLAP